MKQRINRHSINVDHDCLHKNCDGEHTLEGLFWSEIRGHPILTTPSTGHARASRSTPTYLNRQGRRGSRAWRTTDHPGNARWDNLLEIATLGPYLAFAFCRLVPFLSRYVLWWWATDVRSIYFFAILADLLLECGLLPAWQLYGLGRYAFTSHGNAGGRGGWSMVWN